MVLRRAWWNLGWQNNRVPGCQAHWSDLQVIVENGLLIQPCVWRSWESGTGIWTDLPASCWDPAKLLPVRFWPHPPSVPHPQSWSLFQLVFDKRRQLRTFSCSQWSWLGLTTSTWNQMFSIQLVVILTFFSHDKGNSLLETFQRVQFLSLEHSFTVQRKHFYTFQKYKSILVSPKTTPGPVRMDTAPSVVVFGTE